MIRKDIFRHFAKLSDKVKTLGSTAAICHYEADLDIQIDPLLLFKIMMSVATYGEMNLQDVMLL